MYVLLMRPSTLSAGHHKMSPHKLIIACIVLGAGFVITGAVLIIVRVNRDSAKCEIRVTIPDPRIRTLLEHSARSLIVDRDDWRRSVVVTDTIPSEKVGLLKDCEFFVARLVSSKKGFRAAAQKTLLKRRVEAWEGVELRIVAVNLKRERSWVIGCEALDGLAELLRANTILIRRQEDAEQLLDLLVAFRCCSDSTRAIVRREPNLWELRVGGDSWLVLETDQMGLVIGTQIRNPAP